MVRRQAEAPAFGDVFLVLTACVGFAALMHKPSGAGAGGGGH